MSSPLFPSTRPHLIQARRVIIRLIQSLAAIHIFETDILDARLCTGASMLPTLSYDGDWVLVSPLPYTLSWWSARTEAARRQRGIQRGDIVFCNSVRDPKTTISKRVIGIEGDIIEIDPRRADASGWEKKWMADKDQSYPDSKVSSVATRWMEVSEEKVERETDSEGRRLSMYRKRGGQFVKVPKGHVWIVGDNLSNSTDSRAYGPVPVATVKGKVLARIAPNFKWFKNPVEELGESPSPLDTE